MPKITDITFQTKNKSRVNLFVDGEFFSGVSLETVMKYRIKKGDEYDAIELKNIIEQNEKSEALNRATNYLSKTLKTKRQVKDYLIKKGYSEDIVWYCIDKLKEYNYIDDLEYSKRYIENTAKNQGKRMLEYKLMMKGVKKQDIESAVNDLEINSKENAKAVAIKYLKNKEKTKENLAKAFRYILGRGFSYDDANYALAEFNLGD
jgi:regulatory protein